MLILTVLLAWQAADPAVFTERSTPVSDLLGRTPVEVAERLGAAPDPTATDAVRIADGSRVVDLYPATRFWRQPGPGEGCLTGFRGMPGEEADPSPREALVRRSRGVLVFENGRLVSVHPDPVSPRVEGPVTREAMHDLVYGPKPPSPLTIAAGRLPLSDGAGVFGRLTPAPDGLSLVSLCRQLPDRPVRSGDIGTDIAWAMVGLVVLPTVPFVRAEESRAEREGGELLGSVEAGAILAGGVDAFARRRRGVRVYRDAADPGFAVIAIKLGKGRQNAPDVGLLGVRDDRVIWKVERTAADQSGLRALVCRDAENRPSDERAGCSGTGFLIP